MESLINCIALSLGVLLAIIVNLFYAALVLTPLALFIFGLVKLVDFLF